MQFFYLLSLTLLLSCSERDRELPQSSRASTAAPISDTSTYQQLKLNVDKQRRIFAREHGDLSDSSNLEHIQNFWVRSLLEEFYPRWSGTSWDFNGTTQIPVQGAIACGYFVTTVLRYMGVKLQRIKISTCASTEMMKALVPGQKLKNLSALSFADFERRIQEFGKGVYVVGLDFHTGFIVNVGAQVWFIHSYYVDRQGVIKELVSTSDALRSSKTKWMVSLTGDVGFLGRWMKGG